MTRTVWKPGRDLRRTLGRLVLDETASTLPEYALVLAGVSITSALAFRLIGQTATNAIITNANNFTSMNLPAYFGGS